MSDERHLGGLPLEGLGSEFIDVLRKLDGAFVDLAAGEGAPLGFDPRRFIAPGVPRVRPVLVLLSARAAGSPGAVPPDPSATEHVAAAAELLHFAVLVHDAALGRHGGRRRRVARRILGRTVGFLGGNYLTLRALELSRTTPAPEIVGDLLETMREISSGHAMRQSFGERLPSPAEAMSMAEHHTGAGFRFACRSGARVAGASRASTTALGRYGHHTGIAWALTEDLVSVNPALPLTAPGGIIDRAESGRPGLTIAIAAERSSAIAPAWARLVHDPTDEAASAFLELVNSTGAPLETRRRIAQEAWSARTALRVIPESRAREALERIAMKLAKGTLNTEPH